MIILWDGDILIYRSSFAVQRTVGTDDIVSAYKGIKVYIDRLINKAMYDCDASSYEIHLSPKGGISHRHKMMKHVKYKENRADMRRPAYYKTAKSILLDMGAVIADGIEADDALAIRQTQLPGKTIIASLDKDLLMVPGKHYNINSRKILEIKDELGYLELIKGSKSKVTGGGFKWACCQVLTGDRIDNIPGVPKVGPVRAYRLLNGCKSMKECWIKVEDTYKEAGIHHTLEEQMNMIWLLRNEGEYFLDWLKINVGDML